MSAIDTIAAHQLRKAYWDLFSCTCGSHVFKDHFGDKPSDAALAAHAAHVVAELGWAGIALTELPEGTPVRGGVYYSLGVAIEDGCVTESGSILYPDQAREMAANLLAAADTAERNTL